MIKVIHPAFLGYGPFSHMPHDPRIKDSRFVYIHTLFAQGDIQHLAAWRLLLNIK